MPCLLERMHAPAAKDPVALRLILGDLRGEVGLFDDVVFGGPGEAVQIVRRDERPADPFEIFTVPPDALDDAPCILERPPFWEVSCSA